MSVISRIRGVMGTLFPRSSLRRTVAAVVGLIVLCGIGAFVAWAALVSIPAIDGFEARRVAESTKIYDRTGNVLLFDVHGAMRRTAIPLADMSIFIRNATVAIEDDTFYEHRGFRPKAFLRAVLVNLRVIPGIVGQGGSTITQQVVKNTLLTTDKTLIRKAKEIVLALKLERVASKDRILEIYLNETGYGGTIYGVEEASQYYFGKHAKDVTLAEAAYLAALPQAPTRLSPHNNVDPETGRNQRLEDRKSLVLARMLDLGYITQEQKDAALAEEVTFRARADSGIKAPHFVFFVREYLEEKYGADTVANEGLRVVTTLDWDLQQKGEEIVRERALSNEKQFNAENAGLVAIDPKTGQILTMVGSRGYFDEEIDGQVNVTVMPRQPGSSFKPFVYATAFKKGYTPETVLYDVQTQFSTACSPTDVANREAPCYSPDNYDHIFRGPITLRDALAQSVNIPAVKALYLAGITDSLETAASMGVSDLSNAAQYGLTLVLGGAEVKLLEMTSAYGVFATGGVRNPPTGILRIEDSEGAVLEEFKQQDARVMDERTAALINDILSDNAARTPLYGANSPLFFPDYDVAAKTGTTNENRDAWVIGYSPSLVAGAWAGNNIPAPMNQISGLIVTPLWRAFMDVALEKYPPTEEFAPPAPDPGYDSLPGVLRGDKSVNPAFGAHDLLYWVNKDNPRGGSANHNDPQLPHWEFGVSLWTSQNFGLLNFGNFGNIPNTTNNFASGFAVASPGPNSLIPNAPFEAFVEYETALGVTSVSYYLNDQLVGTTNAAPFAVTVQPSMSGPARMRAVAETSIGQVQSEVFFTIE